MKKLSSRIITVHRTPIFFGPDSLSSVSRLVDSLNPGKIFILADTNTSHHCLPLLLEKAALLQKAKVIDIEAGEQAKSLQNAEKLWIDLLASGAGRSDLIINLGGGVVTDLGGFVAAGYQRGINYINIPTSLIGMADAAIGGKTAVNLGTIKNQVGFFHAAKAVFICPEFLKTLPKEHLRSGMAEIIKIALIGHAALWKRLQKNPVSRMISLPADSALWHKLILTAITYKNKVVVNDYHETKLRKVLNFGHTIGHAFEGLSQSGNGRPLLHGEAIAAGMVCAAYLSHHKTGLPEATMEEISAYLFNGFSLGRFDPSLKPLLMEKMLHDKKIRNGRLYFTLIPKPGAALINVECSSGEVSEAIDYYNSCCK